MRGAVLSAFFGMVLTFATALGAMAQQAEIESTITGQFDAFKADDFEGAFAYASPNLQMMFQSFRWVLPRQHPSQITAHAL